ncbi:hypothetical protein [Flectobacillus major]|uniref:hypothetical protein n=1 Tax=Flectobacillus major TaxID=103 RepID=UPI000411029C|nr:hypothetical protein [Flectobacillus major]
MIKYKILWWLFNLKLSLCNCGSEIKNQGFQQGKKAFSVQKVGNLPQEINESSGLIVNLQDSTFWTINDGGGKAMLYHLNLKGELLATKKIAHTQNIDWEEITQDDSGNIYIGDFGNNSHQRKDLTIYKLQANQRLDTLQLQYTKVQPQGKPQQKVSYDAEAMLALGDSLYIFSKNWYKNKVQLYGLSNRKGIHTLVPKSSIKLRNLITGAAINPNKSEFVLISYGKIYYFAVNKQQIDFSSPLYCLKFPHKQTEAIAYLNETDVLITNEQGEIFLVRKN